MKSKPEDKQRYKRVSSGDEIDEINSGSEDKEKKRRHRSSSRSKSSKQHRRSSKERDSHNNKKVRSRWVEFQFLIILVKIGDVFVYVMNG